MKLVQITRAGAIRVGSPADFAEARAEFERRQCLVLEQLIAPPLLETIQRRLAASDFTERLNKGVGTELRLPPGPLSGALEFLTNDPVLFAAIEEITGCEPIGCYRGRVYRMQPAAGHASGWHNDLSDGRMITMSVNLSEGVFEGGDLQLREVGSEQLLAQVRNTGFGDAVIFRIDRALEHQVLPLTGTVERSAYAGWFQPHPSYAALLNSRLEQTA
ncbi:MAG TPA: 2OG-Fe(II) oxygenase [Vicinamibacterales bacterium]